MTDVYAQQHAHKTHPAPAGWNLSPEERAQYFEFSSKVLNSHLTAAYLWIQVRSKSRVSSSSSLSNSITDQLSMRKPSGPADKGQRKKSATNDKKAAWLVVYQITSIDRESGRPELIHVSNCTML